MDNKVAIYIRVSTTHQIDKDSLPMQRKDLVSYCELMLNTSNYVIFEDAGYSGKNMERPQFKEMMARIRSMEFTHVLVWKIDRISRNLLDFSSMYTELKSLGVTFVSKNEQFDTSTAMGEAMLKIILVFAELERNMTSERVTATMISRANNGLWNGGRVPYGYDYDSKNGDFSINEAEAEIVQLLHNSYEQHDSLVHLARMLNDNGCYTKRRVEWSPTSVQIILQSRFYCGEYQYNRLKGGSRQSVKDKSEWVTIENHHDAIIPVEQKDRIIALLEQHRRLTKDRGYHASKNIHVFKGMIRCACCGKYFNCSIANKTKVPRYSNYFCPTRRKSTLQCSNTGTSDMIIGEFLINLVLNIYNCKKSWSISNTTDELAASVLCGRTFSQISRMKHGSLEDLYTLMDSVAEIDVFSAVLPSATVHTSPKKSLIEQRHKLLRAMDRLKSLYLYDDSAISEREFIVEQSKLTTELEKVDAELEKLDTDDDCISDSAFVERASEFIITQNLKDRNYINYKRLASTVERATLRSFFNSIIDTIVYDNGCITSVIFRNGLDLNFEYKKNR